MKNKKPLYILAAVAGVVLIGGLVYYLTRGGENNANFAGGTWWVCTDKACKHEFNLSMKQLSDWHKDKSHAGLPVACQKCGKPAARASKCPACGALTEWTHSTTTCSKCQKTLPPE